MEETLERNNIEEKEDKVVELRSEIKTKFTFAFWQMRKRDDW